MEKPEPSRSKLGEFFSFIRNFAEAFLKKLSPAIRLLYTIGIIIFFYSVIIVDWNLAIFSFILINLLMIFEIADKLTARDELEVARDVQISLIPVQAPDDSDFEISCYYETAKEVGGDFFDFIKKPDNSYLISIGDISGKGMSAALQMVQIRLIFRFISDTISNPKNILVSINKSIFKLIKKGLYFSMSLAEVKDKNMKICRAGHTPALYYNSIERTCTEINQRGMALGLTESELFDNSLEEIEINSNSDDLIMFYSDGLTEAMNSNKNEYGIDRLKNLILANTSENAESIKNSILNEIAAFRGYAEVHDDITFIIMKAK